MYTQGQIKNMKFNLSFQPKANGYTLHQIWQIEKHDELTNDTFSEFVSDVLDMFNNELDIFGIVLTL